jgi:hypothetical protein
MGPVVIDEGVADKINIGIRRDFFQKRIKIKNKKK